MSCGSPSVTVASCWRRLARANGPGPVYGILNPRLGHGLRHKGGTIEYVRGRMRIVDRKKLEKASGEGYEKVRNEYERLVR